MLAFMIFCMADECSRATAAGVYEDGASARAQAMGGASVAGSTSPMDALGANPAELTAVRRPELEAGADAVFAHGEFRNRVNDSSGMNESGLKPKAAAAYPWGPVTFAAGFTPEAALRADWRLRDAPGGADGLTSYGTRGQRSELTLVRFALGAGYQITPQLAIGASLGVLYNHNQLQTPYTIQTHPQLAGAKVLLDLDTEGWGTDAVFGATWKPVERLQLGVSYTLASRIKADGRAHADAGRQLRNLGVTGVDATTGFDAEVTNTFPQIVSTGAAWQATAKLTTLVQLDWINWQSAFNTLDVRLRHTESGLYRSLLAGKSNLDDDVPLGWRDQWVVRTGLEYALTPEWKLRGGYRYARNPVPEATLTPLTAAIGEHVVSAGVGYETPRFGIDLAWQWQLPAAAHVGTNALRGGEYSHSRVELEVQSISLTTRYRF